MQEQQAVIPSSEEQTLAFLAEFLQLVSGFIGPLIIFVAKRESRFVAFHAMQALLWQVIYFGLALVGFILFFATEFASPSTSGPPLGFFALWLLMMGGWLLTLFFAIFYGIKAIRGQWAGYPIIGHWARRIVGA